MSTIDSPERGAAHLPGAPPRILVIQAPYYRNVVEGMRQGAMTERRIITPSSVKPSARV